MTKLKNGVVPLAIEDLEIAVGGSPAETLAKGLAQGATIGGAVAGTDPMYWEMALAGLLKKV